MTFIHFIRIEGWQTVTPASESVNIPIANFGNQNKKNMMDKNIKDYLLGRKIILKKAEIENREVYFRSHFSEVILRWPARSFRKEDAV